MFAFAPTLVCPMFNLRDPYFSNVTLLLYCNGTNNSTTFTDNSSFNRTATVAGAAKISTAVSKFNGSSGYLDGTNSYLQYAATSDFDLGGGDFTVEGYYDVLATTGDPYLFHFINLNTNRWALQFINSTGKFNLYVDKNSSDLYNASSSSPTLNQFNHIAVVKNGTTTTLYLNGASVFSSTTLNFPLGNMALIIGSSQTTASANYANAYFAEFRVTKGIARYNANFTPPDAPFQNS